jgi:hypothetical protein
MKGSLLEARMSATAGTLQQFLKGVRTEITRALESATFEGEEDKDLVADELTCFIDLLREARSKFIDRPEEIECIAGYPNAITNDTDELSKQMHESQRNYDLEEKPCKVENVLTLIPVEKSVAFSRQQELTAIDSLNTELLETIYELKDEVHCTRKAINSLSSNQAEDDHAHFSNNDVRQSSVKLALGEWRQASAALKDTLTATRKSLAEISLPPESVAAQERQCECSSKQANAKQSNRKSFVESSLQKQLDIEIKKRIRAEREVEILNDQAGAYMDQILDLQTENVQLILKADNGKTKSRFTEDRNDSLALIGANAVETDPNVFPPQSDSITWEQLPAFVRNLYQRCEMLEAERQELLESTVELLESSRDANHAKVEAAYQGAITEAERNFGLWLDRAVCKTCNSPFEYKAEAEEPPSRL